MSEHDKLLTEIASLLFDFTYPQAKGHLETRQASIKKQWLNNAVQVLAKVKQNRLSSPELREKIEEILEPTLDRLYHQDLPDGKYTEIAIEASVGMLKSNLTTQILAFYPDEGEKLSSPELREKIFRVLWYYVSNLFTTAMAQAATDQILALIPDEGERLTLTLAPDYIENIEKQEGERIFSLVEKAFPEFAHTIKLTTGYQDDINEWNAASDKWQALKQKCLEDG